MTPRSDAKPHGATLHLTAVCGRTSQKPVPNCCNQAITLIPMKEDVKRKSFSSPRPSGRCGCGDLHGVHPSVLHALAESLHVAADGALHVNPVREPVLIAMDFIARQHRSLVFQNTVRGALQQPACRAPETTTVPAVDQQAFPDNYTLQIVCHFAVSLPGNCTIAVVLLIAAMVAGVASL
jgi:hypothetical protein